MAEGNQLFQLNAIGAQGGDRWTKSIIPGKVICLGRAPGKGWSVPWDMRISREHCEIELKNDRLYVRCLERARNPIYRLGEIAKEFTVFSGETFRIGLTTFRFDATKADEGSDCDFEVGESAAPIGMVETDRVDGEVEQLRDEIASLRAQLQADVTAKRSASQKGDSAKGNSAKGNVEALRLQMDTLKQELNAAQLEIERLQREIGENVSDSTEFKALQADVEVLRGKVQSGEFLAVSAEAGDMQSDSDTPEPAKKVSQRRDAPADPDTSESAKQAPKGLDALRARLAREANERRNRRST